MNKIAHVCRKQENSHLCLVCGLENQFGLKASFYELDNGELMAIFEGKDQHQSYPGRLHGGMASAILDETIGRAIMITEPDKFGVTVELSLKYRKPVPLNEALKIVGRITKKNRKFFEGTGEIILSDGSKAVEAYGKYMYLDINQIMEPQTSFDWYVSESEKDPNSFEYDF